MITIRLIERLPAGALQSVITGYMAQERYAVRWIESEPAVSFHLELVSLAQPYYKHYDYLDEETLARYARVVEAGFSFGAFVGDQLVGIALAEPHMWNQSVWVWEFHVAESHRRQGIGRRMMDALAAKSSAAGLRTLVCETQTTNVPAIRAYRQLGFHLEGIDISYYSNRDYPDGEVAVLMKRRLDE
jgi:ribosomal protein S18 acetylase RimI-like enzyme